MPRLATQIQLTAVEAIRQAIVAEGDPSGPASARRKFPAVPASTWSRWTAQARQQVADDDLRQRADGVAMAEASGAIKPNDSAPVAINWPTQIARMLGECDLLATQAVHVDPQTGLSRVRAPLLLKQSLAARTAALRLAAEREAVVFGAERVRFWEGEVGKAIGEALGPAQSAADMERIDRVIAAIGVVFERREVERIMVGGSLSHERAVEEVKKARRVSHVKA